MATLDHSYKQTELGLIPAEWEIKQCQDLCLKIQDGTHFSPTLGGDDYLYITSKNIGYGTLNISNAETVSEEEHKKIYNRCNVKKGDLLLTKDGVNTGNATINFLEEEFSLLSSVAFLRFDPSLHDAVFFLQYILSGDGQRRLKGLMSGNAITRLTLEKIKAFEFPVPSLPEQQAIAEALGAVDDLLTSLEQLIAKKEAIKQATMQQLLTGRTRLPAFATHQPPRPTELGLLPHDWEVVTLGDIANISSGGTPNRNNQNYWNGKIPWITTTQINFNHISSGVEFITQQGLNNSAAKIYPKGTLLMAMYGQGKTRGKVAILDIDACTNQACAAIQLNKSVIRAFLFQYLVHQYESIRQLSNIGNQQNLNANIIKSISILFPPIEEQQAIAEVLGGMDTELEALKAQRAKTQAIKQGMMQELLTGRTRLPH